MQPKEQQIPDQPTQEAPQRVSAWRQSLVIGVAIIVIATILGFIAHILGTKVANISVSYTKPLVQKVTLYTTPTSIPISPSWLRYTDASGWQVQYPSDMTLTTSNERSRTLPKISVVGVALVGRNADIEITTEPNLHRLTIASWLTEQRQEEQAHCQIDCRGMASSPTEWISLAGHIGELQYLHSVIGTVNVYLPLGQDAILWASASTPGQLEPVQATRELLLSILATLSAAKQNPGQ